MQLERIAAVIRPRGGWEAVDFGFAMAQRWRGPVWRAWWAVVAPAWALAYAPLALGIHPLLGLVVAWWLRPLFDRVPLAVLSRALFGESPRPGDVARSLPRLWGAGALGALTVRRLDPVRSFHLPVHQLERVTGAARRDRLAVLGRQRLDVAAGLTLACWVMELFVLTALFTLAAMLVPSGFDVAWGDHLGGLFTGEAHPAFVLLAGALAFLALALIEPFYVAGGFALYLDRRTHLEGWDVELTFRRLARRLRAGGRRGVAAALLVAVVGAGAAVAASEVGGASGGASETGGASHEVGGASHEVGATSGEVREAVVEVLGHPDFSTRSKVRRWRVRERWVEGEPEPAASPVQLPLGPLALVGEVLMWVAAAFLLGALLVLVVRRARWGGRAGAEPAAEPTTVLFGLDLAPESLPDDVPAAALESFRAGRATEALGLLYRGALARLAQRRSVASSWTEEECVRHLAGQLDPAGADWFGRLAVLWQAAAYGHRAPAEEAFVGLCGGWRSHLGGAA